MTTTSPVPPTDSSVPTAVPTTTSSPAERMGALAAVGGGAALLASFVVVPGPDVSQVHDAGWVPGQALSAIAFGLLALGIPAVATSLGRRLGVLGLVGYAALMCRFILSTGSHLYSLWILPRLASLPDLQGDVHPGAGLTSIYAGHGDVINVVVSVGILGLVYNLARCGRGMRTVSTLLAIGAVLEFVDNPLGLPMFAIIGIWLGLRILHRGDACTPLRQR